MRRLIPVPAPRPADHRRGTLPAGRHAHAHADGRAADDAVDTVDADTVHTPADTVHGRHGHSGGPDARSSHERGEPRNLLARCHERGRQALVLVLQILDLGLQLREPRLFALAALERGCTQREQTSV